MTNKKSVLFLAISLLVFSTAFKVSATESFYVGLDINEKKVGTAINFSLDKATALYGEYDSAFDIYKEDSLVKSNYILETYNSNKELTAKYDLRSSRFIYVDSQEGGGGMIESDEGTIDTVIPYDRAKPTGFVKIDNNGNKTDFVVLPVAQLEEDFKKITLCKKEGEETNLENNHCCSSLTPAQQDNETFICVNCGDGKCSQNENYYSCYKDCPLEGASQKSETPKNPFMLILTVALAIISAVLFVILLIKGVSKLAKRRKNI